MSIGRQDLVFALLPVKYKTFLSTTQDPFSAKLRQPVRATVAGTGIIATVRLGKDVHLSNMSDSRQTILLDLPPEILELIAWNLDPDDLLNLRFVHSYVAGSTQRPMLQRNYTEVHIMLAMPSSLRRALRLIRHSLLRTYVTTVCVYIGESLEHIPCL